MCSFSPDDLYIEQAAERNGFNFLINRFFLFFFFSENNVNYSNKQKNSLSLNSTIKQTQIIYRR